MLGRGVGAADGDRERAARTARSSTGRRGRGRRRWRGSRRRAREGAFEEESAVNAGKAEIRGVIERARERRRANGRPTILFLDEIHRFNKAQQDALLPAVEEGLLTLIGATTENPYFEVNSALLSRGPDLRAAAARAGPGGGAAAARAGRPRARDRRPAAGRATTALAMLADAQRRRRPGRPLGAGAGGRAAPTGEPSTSPRSRTRCSARRSTTTARATATTTSSRPGSRRPAAPTSTPRSTTWR